MKISTLLFAVIIAASMTSCNEVPEDVRSRTEAKNQAISEAKKHLEERTGEIRYISPDELDDDIKAALGQSYANFTVDPSVKISVPKEIVKCDFIQISGFNSKAEKLAEKILGKKSDARIMPDKDEPIEIQDHVFKTRLYTNEEEKVHFCTWDNGFFCFMRSILFNEMLNNGQRTAIYHVDRGDDLSDRYMLGGKEITVRDAVDTVQKWLDDNYAALESEYKLRVKTVIARQNEKGDRALAFTVDRIYKGIPIDELITLFDEDHYMRSRSYDIKMVMKNAGKIDYFTNGSGIVSPKETEKIHKIVSLKSAMEYIERQFADFENSITINYIGLKYAMSPQYDYKNDEPYNIEGTLNKGRLIWEFVIDVPMEQLYIEKKDHTKVPMNDTL